MSIKFLNHPEKDEVIFKLNKRLKDPHYMNYFGEFRGLVYTPICIIKTHGVGFKEFSTQPNLIKPINNVTYDVDITRAQNIFDDKKTEKYNCKILKDPKFQQHLLQNRLRVIENIFFPNGFYETYLMIYDVSPENYKKYDFHNKRFNFIHLINPPIRNKEVAKKMQGCVRNSRGCTSIDTGIKRCILM
jgi:hypothetical protein